MDNRKTHQRMMILAIECSQPAASLCLAKGEEVLFCTSWVAERNHDTYLFPALQQALQQAGSEPLDMVLVGAGPGSYGGVRVALAAAVGISTVRHAQVVTIGSWNDLAADGSVIVSDARRGGWTVRRPDGHIEVLSAEALKAEIAQGLVVKSIESAEVLAKACIEVQQAALNPTAEGLVRSWHRLTDSQQAELMALPAEPIYVRPPHITEAKRKPWELSH